ncbi:MAG: lysylphosphatidylglycerol synthase transmembrane domain-containing protein [Chloroflexota bacterium]|nr:flippase-like domain-containing protein [Dehalococcoidia bacterium]MDW8253748.1 lysylphosphatidylglycerol synthase transmembrane domain-containing protein [Chloroflexota bacterium]
MASRPASEAQGSVALSEHAFWRHLAQQSSRRALIPLIISIAFLLALFLNPSLNLAQLGEAFAKANYLWLGPAVAVFFVGVWVRAVRWSFLLRPIAVIPPQRLVAVLVLGFAANNVLPARAGELVRAHELHRREGVSRAAVLATIVVERVFDGLTLLFLLGVVSFLTPLADWFGYLLRAGALLFLGLLAALLLLAAGGRRSLTAVHWLAARLPRQLGARLETAIQLFLDGLAGVRRPDLLGPIALTSLAAWSIESMVYLLVFGAFGITVPAYVALLVTATANLAITLPSSQGGIGPFEFFAAQTLLAFGVPDDTATAYAFVAHATVLFPVLPLGIAILWRGMRNPEATKP